MAGSREARGEATGTALATTVAAAALTGKKTPGGAGTYWFKDTGGSRDTHETDTTHKNLTNCHKPVKRVEKTPLTGGSRDTQGTHGTHGHTDHTDR